MDKNEDLFVENVDFFGSLIHTIISGEELSKQLENFKKKTRDKELNFSEMIVQLENIEAYLKEHKDDIDKEKQKRLINKLKLMFKAKKRRDELSENELDELLMVINFIFVSLGYMPIKENGKNMSVDEAKEFISKKYKKYH